MFQIHKTHACETYTDWLIYRDTLHEIILTQYHESKSFQAMIATIKDEAQSFTNWRPLPQGITKKLVKLTKRIN